MLAKELTSSFVILDVFAPHAVLEERIERRLRDGYDASDATVDVMERQEETEEPFTQAEQPHVVRVDSTYPQAIISVISELKERTRL
jgi:hypothetical protein